MTNEYRNIFTRGKSKESSFTKVIIKDCDPSKLRLALMKKTVPNMRTFVRFKFQCALR